MVPKNGFQRFVIEKFDDFKFEHNALESQDANVRLLVSKRCQDVMLGCLMTTNSNQVRSNMYTDKNMFANQIILMHLTPIGPLRWTSSFTASPATNG